MTFASDPSTFNNQIPVSFEMPRDYEAFREIGSLFFKRIADAINKKDGSLYYLQEYGNFQSFFTAATPYTFRNCYRMVVNFGALPDTATKSVAHGIVGIDPGGGNPSTFSFTRIYATASKQAAAAESFIPIPYIDTSGTVGSNVGITVDATNVNITTTANLTAYTVCIVVLEYLKN